MQRLGRDQIRPRSNADSGAVSGLSAYFEVAQVVVLAMKVSGENRELTTELDVLRLVSDRLDANDLPFMLTGSFAMAYYTTPRMTRDLDIVVALDASKMDGLVAAFSDAFYIDADDVSTAIASQRLFNLMHYGSGMKIDFIVRKSSEYRLTEFARRRKVTLASVDTWIVSREDLILSKLVWAQDAGSDLQRRDVRQLLSGPVDIDYLNRWAPGLGVAGLLGQLTS